MNKSEQHNAMRNKGKLSPANAVNHWLTRATSVIAVVTVAAMITSPASARWYKWVDENGNISYQDRPPPSSFEETTQVLSQQGVTLETIPGKQEQLRLDREAQREKEKKQRDEALLRAFPNESDLITSRDKRVTHIDGSIARMHEQLVILNNRLFSIEKRIAQRVERSLSPSDAHESDRIAVLRSIDSTDALITSKLRERRQLIIQYDRDILRYRQLKSTSASTAVYSD